MGTKNKYRVFIQVSDNDTVIQESTYFFNDIQEAKLAAQPQYTIDHNDGSSLEGSIVTPLPPDRIHKVKGIVTPKPPRQIDIEQAARLSELPE